MALNKLFCSLCIVFLFSTAFAQSEDFEFRNDIRPGYDDTVSIEQLSELQKPGKVVLFDVRLEEDLAQSPALITGAEYKNPEHLDTWINQIDRSKTVVVYCVAGKWVSQKVAHLLDEAGITVHSLEGGIDAWKARQAE